MLLNGVKPWIISKEDEITHKTNLHSYKMFQNCQHSLEINASNEREVMEQIVRALKTITDQMNTKSEKAKQAETKPDAKSEKSHSSQ